MQYKTLTAYKKALFSIKINGVVDDLEAFDHTDADELHSRRLRMNGWDAVAFAV